VKKRKKTEFILEVTGRHQNIDPGPRNLGLLYRPTWRDGQRRNIVTDRPGLQYVPIYGHYANAMYFSSRNKTLYYTMYTYVLLLLL